MEFVFHSHSLVHLIFFEFVLFAAVGYIIIGIDEIAIDLIWLAHASRNLLLFKSKMPPLSIERLPRKSDPDWFAVFVPARNESAVIGPMLENALKAYSSRKVHIFVGCYANDEATTQIARRYEGNGLSVVVFRQDGASTKAECLNEVYLTIADHETRTARKFSGIVLHDAEDVVDGYEIAVFDAFVDQYAMIQLPVIPIKTEKSRWISGHYCDEFAESHGKTMIVRQLLGAAVPSAGVGCMIRRDAIDALAGLGSGRPFAQDSITEDYEVGLRLAALGLRTGFLRVAAPDGKVVATRACFPATLREAVRQKSRWVTGIALAGWDRVGWGQGRAENWMRLRDRLSLIAAVIAATGYIAAILGSLLLAARLLDTSQPDPFDGPVSTLVAINGWILTWRLAIRFVLVGRIYGWVEACYALPRIFVSNFIAIVVAWRAVFSYVEQRRTGVVRWDKTDHEFPEMTV